MKNNKQIDPFEESIIQKALIKRIKKKGLGDIIEGIAKPIAKVVDVVAGTDLENCGACKKRKIYLNTKFPFRGKNSLAAKASDK